MIVGWDQPWKLAREMHLREGLSVPQLARIFGRKQVVVAQWLVPQPSPERPLVERTQMLRKMGVSWKWASRMLGVSSGHILRNKVEPQWACSRPRSRLWNGRYRAVLIRIRKEIGRT